MKELIAIVNKIDLFGSGYCRLRLSLPATLEIKAGQFAMLKPAGLFEPLLRRAMAFYQVEIINGSTLVDFIFHILGRGTQALASLKIGDKVEFLGPLGKSFSTTPAKEQGKALIVAGGVGTPAVLILAQDLSREGIETHIFLGARTSNDLIGVEDFSRLPINLTVATDDGSSGDKGFVTQSLERFLKTQENRNFVVYTCGPEIMMEHTTKIASSFGLKTFASLEARMACGFGVCVGCVVEIKNSNNSLDSANCVNSSYQRVCVEGPVFEGSEVIW